MSEPADTCKNQWKTPCPGISRYKRGIQQCVAGLPSALVCELGCTTAYKVASVLAVQAVAHSVLVWGPDIVKRRKAGHPRQLRLV